MCVGGGGGAGVEGGFYMTCVRGSKLPQQSFTIIIYIYILLDNPSAEGNEYLYSVKEKVVRCKNMRRHLSYGLPYSLSGLQPSHLRYNTRSARVT